MPNRDPILEPVVPAVPIPGDTETPRGPQKTPGIPDRSQEDGKVPPIAQPDDNKNPNDPTLLPIGDPAGMA